MNRTDWKAIARACATATAIAVASVFAGCRTGCPECEPCPDCAPCSDCEPGARAAGGFSQEQYVWQTWFYGTNKSEKAWR